MTPVINWLRRAFGERAEERNTKLKALYVSAALIPCLAVHSEGVQRRAGAGREAVRAKIKRTSLKERRGEKRVETRLVYVRFMGLDLVSA